MPADPVVYNPATANGRVKHTFTGLRDSFPNRSLHFLILDKIIPLRRELISRPEAKSMARWEIPLATTCQAGLQAILTALQQVTHVSPAANLKPLSQRMTDQQAYIDKVKNKATQLEALATAPGALNSDELLEPASSRIATLHCDWTGLDDPDMAQPTPGRVINTDMRSLIIELDGLVVTMSQSPSADQPRTVNEYDAGIFAARLAEMFAIVQRAASKEEPYLPTSVTRGRLDSVFNADGKYDPLINDGAGGSAEPVPSTIAPAANA